MKQKNQQQMVGRLEVVHLFVKKRSGWKLVGRRQKEKIKSLLGTNHSKTQQVNFQGIRRVPFTGPSADINLTCEQKFECQE